MKHWLSASCGLAALVAVCGPADAANPARCHESPTHVVIVVEQRRDGSNGQEILVKTKADPGEKIPCVYKVAKGDYEVPGGSNFFLGQRGRFLIIDEGTSASRLLNIYDLNTRKRELQASASSDETHITNEGVTFWMRTGEGTPKNCRQFKEYTEKQMGSGIQTRVSFDFASMQLRKTSRTRCVPLE